MSRFIKLSDKIYRFFRTSEGLNRNDSYIETDDKRSIDDKFSSHPGNPNAYYSQTLEDRTPNKGKYAMLLIDMQEIFLEDIQRYTKNKQIRSQIKVLKYCSQKDIPVAILEYINYGSTINKLASCLNKVPRKRYLKKDNKNGFTNAELFKQLEKWGVSHLGLMGIYTSSCVKATGIGAIKNGFSIFTAKQLIAEPKNCKTNKSILWYKAEGKYYDNYKTLLKDISYYY